ncbi:sugar phosphate nucleotidyltransferase [Trichothermofontia sichuanensis B231]|uniref:mannose-1-phosphate guanylyltransferase n=1 Tax=Trichothermofontia sichuanensis TaxID=3045816 RepID=UPI002247E8EE|nr:mannose-1-phosphate guanylyltransferase [Trichothermofontia sichuanensis]UZQ55070.1 sugar phosphate nucleotidyltransferase [Trichothermofontia sichuanensis B231]
MAARHHPALIPVILAGGKGERFWPLSRRQYPKQFLSLDGSGRSLLQNTADRLLLVSGGWEALWVVTADPIAAGVRSQLPDLLPAHLLAEPEGRDTAPAVAWTTLEIVRQVGETAIVGCFPADHWIGDEAAFQRTLAAAIELAQAAAAIVTLGIPATHPATGYGYIEQGECLGTYQGVPAYRVQRFTEKPDAAQAATFLASRQRLADGSETCPYTWNSGMFIFPAGVMLAEFRRHAPDLLAALEREGVAAYPNLPKISLDYAVMERTDRTCVLPAAFDWDDLGDWNALARLPMNPRDRWENITLANHVGLDAHRNIVFAQDAQEVIATIGVDDLVIVRMGKVTLVAHKDRTQEIKTLLRQMGDRPEYQDLL